MTIAGTVPQHHGSNMEVLGSKFSQGPYAELEQRQLLDMTAYYIGNAESRGLRLGNDVVGLTIGVDEDGVQTWNFLLPPFSRGTSETHSHRVILSLTKMTDEEQTVFADRTIAAYCLARGDQRLAGHTPFRPQDFHELARIEQALADELIAGRPPQVVPEQ